MIPDPRPCQGDPLLRDHGICVAAALASRESPGQKSQEQDVAYFKTGGDASCQGTFHEEKDKSRTEA